LKDRKPKALTKKKITVMKSLYQHKARLILSLCLSTILIFSSKFSNGQCTDQSGTSLCNPVTEDFNNGPAGFTSTDFVYQPQNNPGSWKVTYASNGSASIQSPSYFLTPSIPTLHSVTVGFRTMLSQTSASVNLTVTVSVIRSSDNAVLASCTFNDIGAVDFHCYSLTNANLVTGVHAYYKFEFTAVWNGNGEKSLVFDDFSNAGSSNAPLPVHLSSFSASRSNSNVNVSWTTASESNNSGFEIQRRLSNQTDFQPISFVNSKAVNGNSGSAINYSYTDLNISAGVSFYRLKQINLDGGVKYTEIRQVDGSKIKAKTMIYPNPSATGITNLIFTTNDSRNIQVIDMSGQVVKSWNNYMSQELKIVSLKPGIYSITINNMMTTDKETVRLVVTK
jgi:hypothetical protein